MRTVFVGMMVLSLVLSSCGREFGELTVDETIEMIELGIDPREQPTFSSSDMSDEEIDDRLASVLAERERERAATRAAWDEELTHWTEERCPAGGSIAEAHFDPQPNDGRPLDIEPDAGWLRYEIVRVADVHLPSGMLQETGGEQMGEGGTPVPVAGPGTYPFFMALSIYEERDVSDLEEPDSPAWTPPALGQLVLDSTSPPVRWEDDDRFGFGTMSAHGWLGSPEAAQNPGSSALSEMLAWRGVEDNHICVSFERDSGESFVRYFNGWGDGFFPGAAGYDADDNLVAITWFYGHASWVLAGIPGLPPAEVQSTLVGDPVGSP